MIHWIKYWRKHIFNSRLAKVIGFDMEDGKKKRKSSKKALLICILLVFLVLGGCVFYIASSISEEMSQSAIGNLSESLELIKGTVEVLFRREAQYQKMMAQELAIADNPEELIYAYDMNGTAVKISLVYTGQTKGVSNIEGTFDPNELDFSGQNTVDGLPISTAYLNGMGTWAYTMVCPVRKDGREIALLYVEYIYDSFEEVLPEKLYGGSATLYIMDTQSKRFLVSPKLSGYRTAGNLNLEDFYRANQILESEIKKEIDESITTGRNVMFYHDVRKTESLIYMWAVNDASAYLIGYVPVEAIQREGKAVNQNILGVVLVMFAAFFLCCIVYLFYERQQNRQRREREAERETHNKQLAEALAAAQAASCSKTMFLSNMSHDIRTPMNAIIGFTALLAKDPENAAKVKEYTKKIMASGQHLLGLINDILDVSKIESGKAVLTVGEFQLSSMISSVDAIIRPAAREKGQTFEVTVTGVRHESLVGDETRLNQILINLLSNAVKYTQPGGHIWFRIIGLKQRSAQYEHIRIEVEDDGYGMTPEYLKVIFDAFTRAENSTTNKVQGTGLGMAITKNIVEMMGGTIDVTSAVGRGSKFTVELELRISEQESDAGFWENCGISDLLLVSQNEETVKDIRSLMAFTQINVHVRKDAAGAVSALCASQEERCPYQLVLFEQTAGEEDLVDSIRLLRKAMETFIPVVMLCECGRDEMQEEILRADVNGILTKPFFVSALKEKIQELCAMKQEDENGEQNDGAYHATLGGCHFLVAEDNEINSEILREVLSIDGATCEIAENGQLAAECFQNAPPGSYDAILMDVQMPVMNGYDATKQIRAMEREDAKTIPIIAMTANAFTEDVRDALNAGMDAHLAKPIDLELLRATLNKFIEKRG